MKPANLLLLGLLTLGSTAVMAEDGFGRSLQMVKEFRENQAALKGKQFFARDSDKADSRTDTQQLSAHNDSARD